MMKRKLLKLIPFTGCMHEFSWPRRMPNGHHYQVCMLCGAEYEYDWKTMQRTKAVEMIAKDSAKPAREDEGLKRKSSWQPRERRLGMELPILFRAKGSIEWHEGTIENISRSGVRFRSQHVPKPKAAIELVFEMPQEISGRPRSKVVCQGRIAREVTSAEPGSHSVLAAGITHCHYLHEQMDPPVRPAISHSNADEPQPSEAEKPASTGPACRNNSRLSVDRSR